MLNSKQKQTLSYMRSYYRNNGKLPTVRELQEELGYASSRSAQLIINALLEEGFLLRGEDNRLMLGKTEEVGQMTIDIPLVGDVACGQPIFATENIDGYFPVSTQIAKPAYKYFFLRAKGDSMNNADIKIDDGDLVLIQEQHTAKDKDIVVALIDDSATIKELRIFDDYVALVPHSTNTKHRPYILHDDFMVQGIVINSFPRSIF